MCQIVLNIFKYIFSDICPKKLENKKKLKITHQMSRQSKRFLNYVKCKNVSILPNCINPKHDSVKIGSISYYSFSDIPLSFNMLRYRH